MLCDPDFHRGLGGVCAAAAALPEPAKRVLVAFWQALLTLRRVSRAHDIAHLQMSYCDDMETLLTRVFFVLGFFRFFDEVVRLSGPSGALRRWPSRSSRGSGT